MIPVIIGCAILGFFDVLVEIIKAICIIISLPFRLLGAFLSGFFGSAGESEKTGEEEKN